MARRIPWQGATGLALLVLLVVLGTLQYRWLTDVSAAERERMRATLETRAVDFTDAVDRQITRLFLVFQRSAVSHDDPAGAVGDALDEWRAEPDASALIAGVYVVDAAPEGASIRQYARASWALEPAAWPPALQRWRLMLGSRPPFGPTPGPLLAAAIVEPSMPAIIVPVPRVRRVGDGSTFAYLPDPDGPPRSIVVALDAAVILRDVVTPLAAKYFGGGSDAAYVATIVRRDDPSVVVYTTPGEAPVEATTADRVGGLLGPRFEGTSVLAHEADAAGHPGDDRHLAITIVRRAGKVAGGHVVLAGWDAGAWQLRLRCVGGSLEALVQQSRRRNLAVGFGVLLLLAASFALVLASASRQQRSARQQLEFVAAVSHELRTPLAVICSAGENLADGVIASSDQVRQYGALIGTEGHRLSGMIERVLTFAGIQSGAAPSAVGPVDLGRIIEDAVSAVRAEAGDRACTIRLSIPSGLPKVPGDAEALRSALHNVIGNAVKYSAAGDPVDVTVEFLEPMLRVRVTDRGLGIDAADLPHVFKPFFRGRRAADAQVRGSGIGLSIVRHVVAAHGGRIRIDSRPGEGTTVTVDLGRHADPPQGEPQTLAVSQPRG